MSSKALAACAAIILLGGCFQEELPEQNLSGTVVVSGDVVDDIRSLGMVYIGIFEGWNPEQLGYSYPATGPRVGDNPLGDAQPYGGTTVGEYAYPCLRAIQCEVVTGRYPSIDDLLEVNPIANEDGSDMTSEQFYDQCQWYYGWNSVDEFRFVGDELDFTENEAGDYEAEFLAWHSQLPAGSIVWGFVDNDFTTCSASQGAINRRRSDDGAFFREGTNFADVLNFPDKYITEGDLVSSQPTVLTEDKKDGYQLVIDEVLN
ncbi:MAG: hypothetical protein KDA24_07070 [Deltaproteobacteria bacterium]|nr:hypothetical protein [Deltaproteobacteria bacterium]